MANGKNITDQIIQNLEDSGCDSQIILELLDAYHQGNSKYQLHLLRTHKLTLKSELRKRLKQVDCLDYLIYKLHLQD